LLGGLPLLLLTWIGAASVAHAVVLWSDHDARVIHNTPEGIDILGGAVKREDIQPQSGPLPGEFS
jgi:hypothetical protein